MRAPAAAALLLLVACETSALSPREPRAREDQLHVGILVVDGVYGTELIAPYDVFQHTVFHADPGMLVFTVAPTRMPIRTFEGLRITPDHGFRGAPRIDVLVVPSAEHSMDSDLRNGDMIAWVRETGRNAEWIVSFCDGAFVLAQSGLLDGLRVTTFPADRQAMRETFSTVEVLDGVSFVHDGKALTSIGGAPSFEAALYLVERLYGAEAARGVAGGLAMRWNLDYVDWFGPGSDKSRGSGVPRPNGSSMPGSEPSKK